MTATTETYIGFRTYRYRPGRTRCRGGATGAGVPSPCSANRANESTTPGTPAKMRMTPIARVSSTLKNAGRNSQRVIHHGTTPAAKNGATTKKIAEPKIAIIFRMTGSYTISLLALQTAVQGPSQLLKRLRSQVGKGCRHALFRADFNHITMRHDHASKIPLQNSLNRLPRGSTVSDATRPRVRIRRCGPNFPGASKIQKKTGALRRAEAGILNTRSVKITVLVAG